MKKLPLQIRVSLITSLLLAACCAVIYLSVMNSAILKIDSLETDAFTISLNDSTNIVLELTADEVFPGFSDMVAQTKTDFLKQSILITLLIIVIGASVSWFVCSFALRPLRDLSTIIHNTTESDLYDPLPVPAANDEVRQLTESFNHMRNRLKDDFIAQKQFSANAAHELRTPLAIMQTSLEVFRKKDAKNLSDYRTAVDTTLLQIERMNRLINTLLEFQSMHTAPLTDGVPLPELAEEILCDLDPLAEEKQVTLTLLEITNSDQYTITGNEVLLYRAIYNLTENAIKYNREGGTVTLSMKPAPEGIHILIKDSGPGIPKEYQARIFDAFYRIDKSRSRKSGGAGLGLALVKEIATVHGGSVCVADSSETGTTVCLTLPITKD